MDDETILRLGRNLFPAHEKRQKQTPAINCLDQTKGIDHVGHNHRVILTVRLVRHPCMPFEAPSEISRSTPIRPDAVGG